MKYILLFVLIVLLSCNETKSDKPSDNTATNSEISKGENLFKANCANCHRPNEKLVGPALQGVASRWESKTLLYEFIKNSQDVISRNAYAKQLFEEYKQSPMQPFPVLKDEEITSILAYCDLPTQ
jgi:mono/diheme cytochrome c family protein